jgi:hypothetical protein
MPERIAKFLSAYPSDDCARLLGSARTYIHNDQLLNLIQNFDVNNHKKNARFTNQLAMFAFVPGLKSEVDVWMKSA